MWLYADCWFLVSMYISGYGCLDFSTEMHVFLIGIDAMSFLFFFACLFLKAFSNNLQWISYTTGCSTEVDVKSRRWRAGILLSIYAAHLPMWLLRIANASPPWQDFWQLLLHSGAFYPDLPEKHDRRMARRVACVLCAHSRCPSWARQRGAALTWHGAVPRLMK